MRINYVIRILIISLLFCSNSIFPHKQRVHQYMVREAYKLLKLFNNNRDIPELLNNLGTTHTGGYLGSFPLSDNGHPWVDGKIVAGAFREDEEDVVYGYGDFVGDASRYALASITHFWRADEGDDNLSYINLMPDAPQYFQLTGYYPNAYQKMYVYAYSKLTDKGIHRFMARVRLPGKSMNVAELVVCYNSLADMFKNKNVYIRSAGYLDGTQYYNPPLKLEPEYFLYASDYYYMIKVITWEVLGRMTHLLADMSIPAHAHNNSHVSGDPYENRIGVDNYDEYATTNTFTTYWDADRIWNTFKYHPFGAIINPYQAINDNPIHYLMYTVNQLSDHFASRHVDGNDIYNQQNQQLSFYYPNQLQPVTTTQYQSPTEADYERIRNATFPHAIRAIAGLLYWFATEVDLFLKPLSNVFLLGDFTLYAGGIGSWFVTLQNGIEPFTYRWKIMYLDGTGYLQTYESVKKEKEKKEKDKKKDGDIIIEAAPSNSWFSIGTNSPYFYKPHNPYDLRDFKLRCIVTDATNTTKTSNEFYVDVVSYPPEFSIVQNDDNKERTISLAKEIDITSTPSSYSLDQNYPNPFNPTTKISYSLPEASFVTLKVYGILGKEIVTLINEAKPSGKYEVEFNASELPSGTYIYKLTAGNNVSVKKMLLIK